jgi:hypothetical protein
MSITCVYILCNSVSGTVLDISIEQWYLAQDTLLGCLLLGCNVLTFALVIYYDIGQVVDGTRCQGWDVASNIDTYISPIVTF